jgi:hypothetical protein
MPSLVLECPHCGAEKMAFTLMCEIAATTPPAMTARYRTLLICGGCEEAVIGVFDRQIVTNSYPQHGLTPASCQSDPRRNQWQLTAIYPKPEPSKCPPHTPDDLKRIFLQASDSLKRNAPDASGAMSRKVVDVSTQMLLGEKSKDYRTIYDRIEALADKGTLTPDLRDWAHEVRLGGNDAAHDLDPFQKEEAEELLDFAELYLTYVYTLPNRLKERRARPKTPAVTATVSN